MEKSPHRQRPQMIRKKHRGSVNGHHILPSSRGGSNDPKNIQPIDEGKHNGYHRFAGNATVREALIEVLEISQLALSGEFMEDIREILKIKDPEYIYKKGVRLPHKYNDL